MNDMKNGIALQQRSWDQHTLKARGFGDYSGTGEERCKGKPSWSQRLVYPVCVHTSIPLCLPHSPLILFTRKWRLRDFSEESEPPQTQYYTPYLNLLTEGLLKSMKWKGEMYGVNVDILTSKYVLPLQQLLVLCCQQLEGTAQHSTNNIDTSTPFLLEPRFSVSQPTVPDRTVLQPTVPDNSPPMVPDGSSPMVPERTVLRSW